MLLELLSVLLFELLDQVLKAAGGGVTKLFAEPDALLSLCEVAVGALLLQEGESPTHGVGRDIASFSWGDLPSVCLFVLGTVLVKGFFEHVVEGDVEELPFVVHVDVSATVPTALLQIACGCLCLPCLYKESFPFFHGPVLRLFPLSHRKEHVAR